MTRRRICVATAARSEYSAARWLMQAIRDDDALDLQTVVTGSHLEEKFGLTWREIEADGFAIDARVETHLESQSLSAAMGACLSGVGAALQRLAPDVIVVLGDRYELLPICAAATLLSIPLAHIGGGDITEGAIDDSIRHAVTKLSHLHFVGTEEAAKVLRQLGEPPERIFTVGELSLEAFARAEKVSREELARGLGMNAAQDWALLAYHPATLSRAEDWLPPLRHALAALEALPNTQALMTYPNPDPGSEAIAAALEEQHQKDPARFRLVKSLGHRRFVSFLKEARFMIGNSSSALYEAPSARLAAINLGDRQKGRTRGKNVIDADGSLASIEGAIRIIGSPAFQAELAAMTNPYGDGTAAKRVAAVLRSAPLERLRRKSFARLNVPEPALRS